MSNVRPDPILPISMDGSFIVNDVPLDIGTNSLTVTITTLDGQTATQTISLDSAGPLAFQLHASQTHGLVPLTIGLSLTNRDNIIPVKRIDIYCSDDGIVSQSIDNFTEGTQINCTYPAGVFRVRMTVIGQVEGQAEQQLYSGVQTINALEPRYLDNLLRNVYWGMLDRLKVGNVTAALNSVTEGSRDKYNTIFGGITNFSTVINQIGTIQQGTLYSEHAEYLLTRPKVGGDVGYFIYLVPGHDGIWRIDSM